MITGECFCGSVTYQYDGKLHNARSCHCSRCRKAFSSAASAYAEVDKDKFTWLSGKELLTYYPSNKEWGKYFCRRCGSTLCGVHNGNVHGVTLGCLNGDVNVTLQMHIFVGSKAHWDELPQGDVAQYDEFPT
ncbi:MAG: GFA family protein [Candidatus Omnitrophica bacterium]|nr:GFA family protein [Candidatus Omnitrophota bacterium]